MKGKVCMFENVGRKIKGLAWFILALGCVGALIGLIVSMVFFKRILVLGILVGLLLGALQILLTLVGMWFIYGFGELIENSGKTNQLLQKLQKGNEAAQVEAAQKLLEQQLEEDERQARITAYWQEHAEERKALFEKKAAARAALGQKGISKEQKRELSDLISSIDYELSRER